MRSADLKLRSEIPICAAISQPASGNGIISVRQGRASQSCFARTSSISWCSPGGEHLGGFRRPIWGQGYAQGVIGGEIGAGQDILAPQLYPKGHEQAQISEKHESEATDFTPSVLYT